MTENNTIITKVTDFGLSTSVSEITGRVVDNPVKKKNFLKKKKKKKKKKLKKKKYKKKTKLK